MGVIGSLLLKETQLLFIQTLPLTHTHTHTHTHVHTHSSMYATTKMYTYDDTHTHTHTHIHTYAHISHASCPTPIFPPSHTPIFINTCMTYVPYVLTEILIHVDTLTYILYKNIPNTHTHTHSAQ